jgi:hypothetical protein
MGTNTENTSFVTLKFCCSLLEPSKITEKIHRKHFTAKNIIELNHCRTSLSQPVRWKQLTAGHFITYLNLLYDELPKKFSDELFEGTLLTVPAVNFPWCGKMCAMNLLCGELPFLSFFLVVNMVNFSGVLFGLVFVCGELVMRRYALNFFAEKYLR